MGEKICNYLFLMLPRIILSLAICFTPLIGLAGTNITFPFSSSFNCTSDWPGNTGGSWVDIAGCIEPWQRDGTWATNAGMYDKINGTYNNPNGSGYKGFGKAVGDGVNNGAGSIRLSFSAQQELYIRFYMKYPLGFAWSGGVMAYQKIWYTNPQDPDARRLVFQFKGADDIGYWLVGTTGQNADVTGHGWKTIMGGATGDGQWHCYESHIKAGNPGVLQTWVDGVLVQNDSTQNVGVHSGWTVLELMSNQRSPANGGDVYIALDDFAIHTTGPIGCLSGGEVTAPAAPTGLIITNP